MIGNFHQGTLTFPPISQHPPPLLRYVAEVIAVATYKLFGKILSFLIFTQIASSESCLEKLCRVFSLGQLCFTILSKSDY